MPINIKTHNLTYLASAGASRSPILIFVKNTWNAS